MPIEDWLLDPRERGNDFTRIDSVHPDVGWTSGNQVRAIVHGKPYFAELFARIGEMGEGDRFYFVDWQGDPDQQLTDDPGSTLSNALVAAVRRGVDVRGLLWRSHWEQFGYGAGGHRRLGLEIQEAGGQCLRDMRVRFRGSHHQKFVVIRHHDAPERDIAFVGGIDLCHSRRDDEDHRGDPQAKPMGTPYGPRPAWHDVQVALTGPAIHDVETTFRERWEDSTPLTLNPGRLLTSLRTGEALTAEPLGDQWPPPPPVDEGHAVVQILRTFPKILPQGFDFAPDGEQSVRLGNQKAIRHAERLVYVEDQYFWSEAVGEHFGRMLRENTDVRLIVVLPLCTDRDGAFSEPPQLHGRALAMERILEVAPDRVAVFGLTNDAGLPIYVHSKACIIDHRWATVGSDNLNRRSWTSDSEIAVSVLDDRGDLERAAPVDSFPRRLLRTLVAEHLGCPESEVPEDPHALFDAMVAAARALDEWYDDGERDPVRGIRGRVSSALHQVHLPGKGRSRRRHEREGDARTQRAGSRGQRPPGRLRRLDVPRLTESQKRWAPALYDRVFDPDGGGGHR